MIILHESRATALRIDFYDPLPNPVPVPAADVFDAPAVRLCLNKSWVEVVAAVLERLAWEDAWEGNFADVDRAIQNANELYAALFLNPDCADDLPTWDSGGIGELIDCIELSSTNGTSLDTITIKECECDMPVYVNIYDGCGCGDGSGGGHQSGGGTAGNGSDIDISFPELGTGDDKQATVCDGAFSLVPYIIAQGLEFARQGKTFVDGGNVGIDFITDAADGLGIPGSLLNAGQELLENLKNVSFTDLENALLDVDFELIAQIAWVKTFGGVQFQPEVTRESLRQWARRLPIVWGGVLDGVIVTPSGFFLLFSAFANLEKIRGRTLLARGSSSEAFCQYVYSESQVIPPQLPAPPGSLPAPESIFEVGSYRITRLAGTQLITNANALTINVASVPNFQLLYTYWEGGTFANDYATPRVGLFSDTVTNEQVAARNLSNVADSNIFTSLALMIGDPNVIETVHAQDPTIFPFKDSIEAGDAEGTTLTGTAQTNIVATLTTNRSTPRLQGAWLIELI